jgi:hypothetical protein
MTDLYGAGGGRSLASGSLERGHKPSKSGRARVLRLLYRTLRRDPDRIVVLRPNGAHNLRWVIDEAPALTARTLRIERAGEPDVVLTLDDRTIAQVRDDLLAAGVTLAFATSDPELLTLGALALEPGSGEQWQSNGDHIYLARNTLWAWADPIGRWLDQGRADIAEMLRMLVVRQSGGYWSEFWASHFDLQRKPAEPDSNLNYRTEYEWRRPRSNPKAIEKNIQHLLGETVRVREPWREMMIVSQSEIGGGDHLPQEREFAFHRAQLVSRDFVDWPAAMIEAEADRPAGTLFLPPITLPDPWLIDASGGDIHFGGTTTHGGRIQDYDGQIISSTWDLSDTFVLLNPVLYADQLTAFTSDPLPDPGDIGQGIVIALGSMVVSDQWALGDEQSHLPGNRPAEDGGGMVVSGGEAVSDYEHRLYRVPVDAWRHADQAFDPGLPFPLQPQGSFNVEQGGGAVIVRDGGDLFSGDSITTAFSAGAAYAGGWTGKWNDRTWAGAYPYPEVAFGATDPTWVGGGTSSSAATASLLVPKPLAGAVLGRSAATGALSTAIRLVGAGTARSAATGDPALPILFNGSGAAQALGSATLATGVRLTGGGQGGATGAAGLATTIRLAGAGVASSSGSLTPNLNDFIASVSGLSAASGALTTRQSIAASGAAQASGTGALQIGMRLAGSGAATAAGLAALATAARFASAASVRGQSLGAGALTNGIRFAGAGAATAAGSGLLASGSTWNPSALGSALVYAVDTNDTAAVADDGAGKAQFARHLYDPNKYMGQSTAARRPAIATANGASGTKRVLTFGTTGVLETRADKGGAHAALLAVANAASDQRTGAYTIVSAVKLDGSAGVSTVASLWVDEVADLRVQVRQSASQIGFGAFNTLATEAKTATRQSGWHVLSAVKDGASLTFRIDGAVVGTATMGAEAGFTASNFALGGFNDAGVQPGLGPQALSGVIVTNTALSGTTLASAEAWARGTAGIVGAALAGIGSGTASASAALTATSGTPAATEYDASVVTYKFEPSNDAFVTLVGGKFSSLRSTQQPDDASYAFDNPDGNGPAAVMRGGRRIMQWPADAAYCELMPQNNDMGNIYAWTGGDQVLTGVLFMPAAFPAVDTNGVLDFMPALVSYLYNSSSYQHAFGLIWDSGGWRLGIRVVDATDYRSTWATMNLTAGARYVLTARYTAQPDGTHTVALFVNGAAVAMAGDGIAPNGRPAEWMGDYESTSIGFCQTVYGSTQWLGGIGDLIKVDGQLTDAQIAAQHAVAMARYPS